MNRLKQHHKTCEICQCKFWSHRSDAKTCGETCKKRRQRGTQYAYTNKGGWRTFEKLPEKKSLAHVPAKRSAKPRPKPQLEVPATLSSRDAWHNGTEVTVNCSGISKPGRVEWWLVTKAAEKWKEDKGMIPINLGFSWRWAKPGDLTRSDIPLTKCPRFKNRFKGKPAPPR